MSNLPPGEAIPLVFALMLAGIVFAGIMWAAWMLASDEGDAQ
jgi:hypothetical protein